MESTNHIRDCRMVSPGGGVGEAKVMGEKPREVGICDWQRRNVQEQAMNENVVG